ncbi:MAG: M3 family oligoendopeptidase [Clostridia bacterium]|nr:M3 family oligoendopeptidase [Clostridia bacterium]
MKTNWDLTVFYKDFDDPEFKADLAALEGNIAAFAKLIDEDLGTDLNKIRCLIAEFEHLGTLLERLRMMVSMTLACEAGHEKANAANAQLRRAFVSVEQAENALSRYLASVENLGELIAQDEMLKKNDYFLLRSAEDAKHTLPENLEEPVLKMQLSGGKMFSELRDKLDATLEVDYREEKIPLSAVRSKAYDADPAVRKDAYEAEIASYKKIELPMSYCLNAIKSEARTMAALTGYEDVLTMTLDQSGMTRKTLDAMWTAISEALPDLRKYFKAKGRLLGHKNGLPFYDLFAPVGSCTRTYTIEEARDLLVDIFNKFSPELSDMMARAFDEGWIDVYPRAGKRGGAFCAGCYQLGVSRIMTNFTGSLSDVSTLAHELGHAFNNQQMLRVPRLMCRPPMPLAETASTFNETVLSDFIRENASAEEEITLLDASLMENTQVMVDIYSRFLFEQKVVDAQADHALSVKELKETMLWAQEQSYGDGLDPEVRHPYMWACKSHYYSTGRHFYNFPYAFGGLFGRGLYARYKAEGESFVPVYCDLLSRFGSDTIENVTASVGIDVTTPDFWRAAVKTVVDEALRFDELVGE